MKVGDSSIKVSEGRIRNIENEGADGKGTVVSQ